MFFTLPLLTDRAGYTAATGQEKKMLYNFDHKTKTWEVLNGNRFCGKVCVKICSYLNFNILNTACHKEPLRKISNFSFGSLFL